MMKTLATSVWVLIVALGAAFGAVEWQKRQAAQQADAAAGKKEVKLSEFKTRPINVPIISDGTVQGYIVAQFAIMIDDNQLKEFPIDPQVYVVDEAFKTIYAGEKLNFKELKKTDLPKFAKLLSESVNARLGRPMVQEILIQQLGYIPKDDMRGDNK